MSMKETLLKSLNKKLKITSLFEVYYRINKIMENYKKLI